jgi:hypothetical protein
MACSDIWHMMVHGGSVFAIDICVSTAAYLDELTGRGMLHHQHSNVSRFISIFV